MCTCMTYGRIRNHVQRSNTLFDTAPRLIEVTGPHLAMEDDSATLTQLQ
jgi:hypothetical protein